MSCRFGFQKARNSTKPDQAIPCTILDWVEIFYFLKPENNSTHWFLFYSFPSNQTEQEKKTLKKVNKAHNNTIQVKIFQLKNPRKENPHTTKHEHCFPHLLPKHRRVIELREMHLRNRDSCSNTLQISITITPMFDLHP